MFGGPYNRLPYGRTYAIETLFTVNFESTTEVGARLSLEFPVTVVFESRTELGAPMTREIAFGAAIESATELFTQMTRERTFASAFSSFTELTASPVYSHIDTITFTGDFAPGDRLVIDTRTKTITLNGVNVLDKMDGDFFELIYGENALTYTDKEGNRNVLARVTHLDRYLY